MKKSTIILIAIVAIIGLWAWKGYNGMVTADETVKNAWAKVQSDYQRRADLIPNLVNVVKGYAEHEKGTLEGVIEARAKATQININVDDLTEENMKKIQAAQGELSSALNKLMAVAEAYPDLKANENFKELQSQLEGTENRIKESRNKYNDTVQEFNTKVRKFPNNILASVFGIETKVPFEADESAQKAPEVKF
jgi:LemA protein